MEDLVLEYGRKKIIVEPFDQDGDIPVTVNDGEIDTYFYLTPDQVRNLRDHLTNCLKEVENG